MKDFHHVHRDFDRKILTRHRVTARSYDGLHGLAPPPFWQPLRRIFPKTYYCQFIHRVGPVGLGISGSVVGSRIGRYVPRQLLEKVSSVRLLVTALYVRCRNLPRIL